MTTAHHFAYNQQLSFMCCDITIRIVSHEVHITRRDAIVCYLLYDQLSSCVNDWAKRGHVMSVNIK